ncbi:hypothetical protein CC86DRAFT_472534 [Ophiobolus disseminans]|uniref:NAD dependent epimerase/dehydratase n=1 Tax=Ophiobolus disseminans TaxID=1469910 RepID=A0A6A6ZEZ2_9PLEO|nr:hypothetical protein CC86DRAFT_472534 [Ophiobolus disseminans]
MGQSPSTPTPGTPFLVIGAGLPRTGTTSLTLALSTLLNGPIYHGGTQCTLGPELEILSWIKLLSHYPPTSPSSRLAVRKILEQRLTGYAGVTDAPCAGLVEELLEIYPDALVICTMRDVDKWEKSMSAIASASTLSYLRLILFLLPTMRYFPSYIDALRAQWVALYGRAEPATRHHWDAHTQYLKRVVPAKQLLFYDVREGWGPLCEALGKEVPEEEFPRVNDSRAIEELARKMVLRGVGRWGILLGSVGVGVGAWLWMRGA